MSRTYLLHVINQPTTTAATAVTRCDVHKLRHLMHADMCSSCVRTCSTIHWQGVHVVAAVAVAAAAAAVASSSSSSGSITVFSCKLQVVVEVSTVTVSAVTVSVLPVHVPVWWQT